MTNVLYGKAKENELWGGGEEVCNLLEERTAVPKQLKTFEIPKDI